VPSPAIGAAASVIVRPPWMLLGLELLAFGGLLARGCHGRLDRRVAAERTRHERGGRGGRLHGVLADDGNGALRRRSAGGAAGSDRRLRGSATVAAIGLVGGLLVGRPVAAIAGFGLVGLRISNVVPILFSAAGRVRGVAPGLALAAVATTGYVGFLAGPPLIGLAAEVTSLPLALRLVSASCAAIAAGARWLPPADR
jgi:hypothetical protein